MGTWAVAPEAPLALAPDPQKGPAPPQPLIIMVEPQAAHEQQNQQRIDEDVHDEGHQPMDRAWFDRYEPYILTPKTREHWLWAAGFWSIIIGISVWFSVWAFPRIVDSAFDPATAAIEDALTLVEIGAVVVFAVMLLPITLILPSSPFVWLAAVVFSFPVALGLIVLATTFGMLIPYVFTRYTTLRLHVRRFLYRYRYTKAVLLGVRKAGAFNTTIVTRISPIPYPLLNYLLAVPDIPIHVYLPASLLGTLPGNVVGVLFGRNIKGLSDLLQGRHVPASQITYSLVSLAAACLVVVAGIIYANRVLDGLEEEAKAEEMAVLALVQPQPVVVAEGAPELQVMVDPPGQEGTDTERDLQGPEQGQEERGKQGQPEGQGEGQEQEKKTGAGRDAETVSRASCARNASCNDSSCALTPTLAPHRS